MGSFFRFVREFIGFDHREFSLFLNSVWGKRNYYRDFSSGEMWTGVDELWASDSCCARCCCSDSER